MNYLGWSLLVGVPIGVLVGVIVSMVWRLWTYDGAIVDVKWDRSLLRHRIRIEFNHPVPTEEIAQPLARFIGEVEGLKVKEEEPPF